MKDRRLQPKRLVTVEGELCALIPLTQGRFAIVDDDAFDELNRWKWNFQKTGYAGRMDGKRNIAMHRTVAKTPDGLHTDHKNHNGLDNRRSNLRIVTKSENCLNRTIYSNNKLGIKGVRWRKDAKKFQVEIALNGKSFHLGYHATLESARAAYEAAALRLHGAFACIGKHAMRKTT